MRTKFFSVASMLVAALSLPPAALCGGAWVPDPGQGDFQLGFSQKTAHTSWDVDNRQFRNTTVRDGEPTTHFHDFRYTYLAGEVGMLKRLSATFLVTYLHGLEGPSFDLEENSGLSDAWFGLKYSLRQGSAPMALAFTVRTPYFYDLEGDYSRHLYDDEGNFRGVSPEWRGLLKHDYTLSYLASRSFRDGRGWWNAGLGYTWREGAPADEIPVFAELGWPLPWWGAAVKGSLVAVRALGNDSTSRPDDRFRARDTFNFNDASMARAGLAFIVPIRNTPTNVELGYNKWFWGESARCYEEPYMSLGYRF
jgi:hypothetical protein